MPATSTFVRFLPPQTVLFLATCGWRDLVQGSRTICEFIPDYYDEAVDKGGFPIPKSIRHRWPDATRDEVLARLLKLNAERAEEERRAGVAGDKKTREAAKTARSRERHKKKIEELELDFTHRPKDHPKPPEGHQQSR